MEVVVRMIYIEILIESYIMLDFVSTVIAHFARKIFKDRFFIRCEFNYFLEV